LERIRPLSSPDTKTGRLQRACLELLSEHERDDALPTNGRFLFYELEQKGVVPKHYVDEDGNPKQGGRPPSQDITDALTQLRDKNIIPWRWITDETRRLVQWQYARTVFEYAADAVEEARIDLWAGEPPPLIICESRAVMGVLERLTSEFLVPITATGGQCRGFLINEIAPLLEGNDRRVGYIGDHEVSGPAEQIEANTRRVLERHANRKFDDHTWQRIALTQAQVDRNPRLKRLVITKYDNRYKPAKSYEAIECEAMKQIELVKLVRAWLNAQLPEPLDSVLEREERQREQVQRDMLEAWRAKDDDEN
jgi:hypothetical protein